MKTINKEEMFGNLKSFLKSKGIELQDGAYTHRIRKACEIMTDSVNLSERAFRKTKNAVDRGLNRLREVIHEQTAPKSSPPPKAPAGAAPKGAKQPAGKASSTAPKSRPRRKTRKG
jgi:hypothetical protein